jgi:hypothetical protein
LSVSLISDPLVEWCLTVRRNATTGTRWERGAEVRFQEESSSRENRVVARFHGGFLDGQLVADWAAPPGTSVWIERVEGGVIATERPPQAPSEPGEERPGYDHYVLSEVVADLAVYHALEG